MFEVGRTYSRRDELHRLYGGQQQGGISTPTDQPFIMLFTGESGEQYGYRDGWGESGVFVYTGEGQTGDMVFLRGNRAIREHVQDDKVLARISQMTPFALACNLRQPLENKGVDTFHANVTGEPNG